MVKNAKTKRNLRIIGLALMVWAFLGLTGFGQTAPDATDFGPLDTTNAEYKFPAAMDLDVLPDLPVEIWARVFMPADLSSGPYPLVIFLHGNHATCGHGMNPRIDDNVQYTTLGTCPPGYVVTPNHAGYDYLADRLASWGYIVVSINANRGITGRNDGPSDAGLNLARGRLVLRHLQHLSEWNTNGGTPPSLGVELQGQLNFSSVALVGHSRGGEGVRAAYNLYRDAGSPWPDRIPDSVNTQSIFEIAPVDGQTPRTLNADGTVWNVLLPMCDGDVSDLQGVKPFDRMLRIFTEAPATQKSTFAVWGANHNSYNTEWQQSDSFGCQGPGNIALFPPPPGSDDSPQQRQTSLASVMALIRGNVGASADPTFNENFNPQFSLPDVVTTVTRVDRGYTDSPNSAVTTTLEDFDRPTGTSSEGFANDASNITIIHASVPNHSPVQRAGVISWSSSGADTYFQTNFADVGTGIDISGFLTLDLRVSRQNSSMNPVGPTNFSIQLAMDDDSLSDPVQLNSYTDLRGPVGGLTGGLHPILQTARILLTDFTSVDLTRARGVRLTFDDTGTGAIYVANIRLSNVSGLMVTPLSGTLAGVLAGYGPSENQRGMKEIGNVNFISSIRALGAAAALGNQPGVEIEVTSDEAFPVRNELPVLRIGAEEFILSRYPASGDTHSLIFSLTPDQFGKGATGDPVTLQFGRGEAYEEWNFGPLDKSMLNRTN